MRSKLVSLFLLSVLLFIAGITYGQRRDSLPSNHEDFIDELDKMMRNTKRDDSKEISKIFEGLWESGTYSAEAKNKIIQTSNSMLKRKMRTYPYFQQYLEVLLAYQDSPYDEELFLHWIDILKSVLVNSKKGSSKDYEQYVNFSKELFLKNHIYSSRAKNWKSSSTEWQLLYDSVPKLRIPSLTLTAFYSEDTISIMNTSGVYYPLEEKWKGKGGRVYWTRAGIDTTKAWAEINNYELDISKSLYTIDSIIFYYPDFMQEKPLEGKLTDKIVPNNDPENSSYPRFDSYRKDIFVEDLAEKVNYKGGLSFHGSKVIGNAGDNKKALLTFYSKSDSLAVRSSAEAILIRQGEELFASNAETTIYLGEDSIYQPGVDLKFKVPTRKLSLLRGETGLSKTSFYDSYHKMEVFPEVVEWPIDSNYILMKMLVGQGKTPAYFESLNYFEKGRLDKYQGVTTYNPVHVIKKYAEDYGTNEIYSEEFAKKIGLSVEQVRRLLYKLVEDGFIYYDQDIELITVRPKTFNYVFANAELIDYDVIRITSVSPGTNGILNMINYDLDLEGVKSVLLSDSQFVLIFPRHRKLTVRKNRNMEFDGTVFAGRMDYHGEGFTFDYDEFKVGLNQIDSFLINIPGTELDERGKPKLLPLKTTVEGLTGGLYIDAPYNKSGKDNIPKFPMFESLKESYAYYNRKSILGGVYPRDRFYFELNPFVIDSLDTFDPAALEFDGTFVSAGIFPDIKEKLKVMPDRSLGFVTESPPEGYPLYGGIGNYYNIINLSNNGLLGSGVFTYLPSTSRSENITFYPDSLNADVDSFDIKKSTVGGTEYPEVLNSNVYVHWMPYMDSMYIFKKDKPFTFYEKQSIFNGDLVLSSKELAGNGVMEWEEALLTSDYFVFKSDVFDADTSFLEMKSLDATKMAFSAPNVKSHIDFKNRTGDFVSNSDDFPVNFPYNQYKTSIQEFMWDMDNHFIDFKAPPKLEDSYFTSTHPYQDSLEFHGTGAKYSLETNLLEVFGVPYIDVADAQIFPDTGYVAVEPEAKMRTLNNSRIEANRSNRYHTIYDAVVNVQGRKEYTGEGKYDYINITDEIQTIYFDDIFVTREGEKLTTTANGKIKEEKNFVLNPRIRFKGNVKLNAERKYLTFEGYSKFEQNHPKVTTQWFSFSDEINPDSLTIKLNEPKNENEEFLFSGIHLTTASEEKKMYTTILNTKTDFQDHNVLLAEGLLSYNEKTNEFKVGDEDKIQNKSLKGSYISFNDQKGTVYAEGPVDLGSELGLIKMKTAGNIKNNLNEDTYDFDLVLGMKFELADEVLKVISNDIEELSYDMPDVNYQRKEFERAIVEFTDDEKVVEKIVSDLHKTGTFIKQKDIEQTLLFTDLKMYWDPETRTYRSEGPVGLGYIGDKPINKMVKAYIEFGSKRSGDYFNIYIQMGMENWYFFQYTANTMYIVSSNDAVKKAITEVEPDDRRVKDGTEHFQYTIGTDRKMERFKSDFEQNMR